MINGLAERRWLAGLRYRLIVKQIKCGFDPRGDTVLLGCRYYLMAFFIKNLKIDLWRPRPPADPAGPPPRPPAPKPRRPPAVLAKPFVFSGLADVSSC